MPSEALQKNGSPVNSFVFHFHKNNKNSWKCCRLCEPILRHSLKFCLCWGITAFDRMSQNSLRLAALPSKNKKNATTTEHIHTIFIFLKQMRPIQFTTPQSLVLRTACQNSSSFKGRCRRSRRRGC